MLTEETERTEEIKEILRAYLRIDVTGKALDALQVAQLTAAIMGINEAAAAIAKRLREGVVFRDTGECHGLTYGAKGERMRVVNTDKMQLNMHEMLEDIPDGQLVSVTVKIVEGAKDES